MHPSLNGLSAAEVIALLELRPHPEGGHYRETFRDEAGPEGDLTTRSLIPFLAITFGIAWGLFALMALFPSASHPVPLT